MQKKKIKKKKFLAVFAKDFNETENTFDFSVVFHEDFMGKNGTEETLVFAGKKTRLNGKIYFICKTSRGAKNFAETMKELFGNSTTLGIRNGVRLIASEKKKGIEGKINKEIEQKNELKTEKLIEFGLRSKKYFFYSSFGVFSAKKIDEGTKLLLECLKKIKEKRILDFGCGLGIIGIVLAKENPEAGIVLLDSDFKSVKLTEKNIKKNELNNAETIVSDGFKNFKGKFDLIASNLPTHEKREFLEEFVLEAEKRLNSKGRLVLVLNKAVFLEKELNQVFGNHRILAQGEKHKVIEAVKNLG